VPSRRELVARRTFRLAAALVGAAGLVRLGVTVQAAMLGVAAVPALATALVVVALDRGREPWTAMAAAFVWGAAVAAGLSGMLNQGIASWLASSSGGAAAGALAPVLVGPPVEELVKAAALAVLLAAWRDRVGGVREGVVYGALLGLGFAMAENADYFVLTAVGGGPAGLARSVWLRGLLAPSHAVFTATAGAGLGFALGTRAGARRVAAPALALALAIVHHVLWNRFAAGLIEAQLCGAAVPGGPCRDAPTCAALLVVAPLVSAAFLAPGAAGLAFVLATAARRTRGVGPHDRATPAGRRSQP